MNTDPFLKEGERISLTGLPTSATFELIDAITVWRIAQRDKTVD